MAGASLTFVKMIEVNHSLIVLGSLIPQLVLRTLEKVCSQA